MDDLQRGKKASLTFTDNRHDNSICGTMGPHSLFAVAEITETPFVADEQLTPLGDSGL